MLNDPFCIVFKVCVWIIVRLEDPNIASYNISNRISHLLMFYLLVFDRIHDVSKQDVQDPQQRYRPTTLNIQQYISLYTWDTFYPCVHKTHLECLLLKSFKKIFI